MFGRSACRIAASLRHRPQLDGHQLDCEQRGMCIDVCPVGASLLASVLHDDALASGRTAQATPGRSCSPPEESSSRRKHERTCRTPRARARSRVELPEAPRTEPEAPCARQKHARAARALARGGSYLWQVCPALRSMQPLPQRLRPRPADDPTLAGLASGGVVAARAAVAQPRTADAAVLAGLAARSPVALPPAVALARPADHAVLAGLARGGVEAAIAAATPVGGADESVLAGLAGRGAVGKSVRRGSG